MWVWRLSGLANSICIGVGSNIVPEENIFKACALLKQTVTITAVSTFYWTPAIERQKDSDYLNGVWQIKTDILPENLKFDVLQCIEKKLGRVRTADKYAARVIDLDILLYDDLVLDSADLIIPDPDIYKRSFIRLALLELKPNLILPDSGKNLREILNDETNIVADNKFTVKIQKLVKLYSKSSN